MRCISKYTRYVSVYSLIPLQPHRKVTSSLLSIAIHSNTAESQSQSQSQSHRMHSTSRSTIQRVNSPRLRYARMQLAHPQNPNWGVWRHRKHTKVRLSSTTKQFRLNSYRRWAWAVGRKECGNRLIMTSWGCSSGNQFRQIRGRKGCVCVGDVSAC